MDIRSFALELERMYGHGRHVSRTRSGFPEMPIADASRWRRRNESRCELVDAKPCLVMGGQSSETHSQALENRLLPGPTSHEGPSFGLVAQSAEGSQFIRGEVRCDNSLGLGDRPHLLDVNTQRATTADGDQTDTTGVRNVKLEARIGSQSLRLPLLSNRARACRDRRLEI